MAKSDPARPDPATQKLKADDPETGARFGESLEADIASSNIYVGSPRSSGVETNTGAVYVFEFIDDYGPICK